MIAYHRNHVRVTELFYEESAAPAGADVARWYFRSEPKDAARCEPFHTLLVDLTQTPDAILAGMRKNTRAEVRKAAEDPAAHTVFERPDDARLAEFFAFYDRFAAAKGMKPANRDRITAMRDTQGLDLTAMIDNGDVLVWHCYFRAEGHARLLHSASLFREGDKTEQQRIGRVNRRCHWLDMLHYRESGMRFYDFGGWYAGSDDEALLKINDFKEAFGGERKQFFNIDEALTVKGYLAIRAVRRFEAWKAAK